MGRFKVMSYNIRHGKGLDGKIDLKRIAELILSRQVDLIGLQEVDQYMPRSYFTDQMGQLAEITGYNYCFYPNLKLAVAKYGNGVLSRWPITSSYNQQLTSSREPRGAVVAVVEKGMERFKLINTHLGLVAEERLKQVEELLRLIKPGEKAILVGDFNATPERPEIGKVLAAGMSDLFLQFSEKNNLATEEGMTFADRSKLPNVRIDYIFSSREIEVDNFAVIACNYSDHRPLIAEVFTGEGN